MACYSIFLAENRIITRFFRGEVRFLRFFPNYFYSEIPIFIGFLAVGTGSKYQLKQLKQSTPCQAMARGSKRYKTTI